MYIHIVLISVSKIVLNNPILVRKFTTVINKVIMLAAVKCSNIHCYYFSSKGSKHTILCITCYEHVVAGLGRLLFLKPASTKSKAKLAPTEVTIIKVHSLPSFRTGLAAVNSSTNKMDTKTLLLDASKQPPGLSFPNDPLIPNLLKIRKKRFRDFPATVSFWKHSLCGGFSFQSGVVQRIYLSVTGNIWF